MLTQEVPALPAFAFEFWHYSKEAGLASLRAAATTRIRSVNDARQFFEAIDGSHYHMMRDFPDRRDEYAALKIDEAQERQWRRAMIAKPSERLLNPATNAGELWWLHSRLERLMLASR